MDSASGEGSNVVVDDAVSSTTSDTCAGSEGNAVAADSTTVDTTVEAVSSSTNVVEEPISNIRDDDVVSSTSSSSEVVGSAIETIQPEVAKEEIVGRCESAQDDHVDSSTGASKAKTETFICDTTDSNVSASSTVKEDVDQSSVDEPKAEASVACDDSTEKDTPVVDAKPIESDNFVDAVNDVNENNLSSIDVPNSSAEVTGANSVEGLEAETAEEEKRDLNCAEVTENPKDEVPGNYSEGVEETIDKYDTLPESEECAVEDDNLNEGEAANQEEVFHDTQTEDVQEHASEEHDSHQDDEDYDTVEEDYRDVDDYSDEDDDDYVIEKEYVEGDGGDGEEDPQEDGGEEEAVVDEDEDRRNPQYIPKKGVFYEHDDRLTETPDEGEVKEESAPKSTPPAGRGKKLWRADTEDSWGHDKFNETDQQPKPMEELVGIYGYNIREESGPPRARRRRRYGRGPNKYTRNWEDEQAYSGRGRGFRGRGRGRGRGMHVSNRPRSSYESTSSNDGAHDEQVNEANVEFKKEDFPTLNESSQRQRSPLPAPPPRGRMAPRPFNKRQNDRDYREKKIANQKVRSSTANKDVGRKKEIVSDSSETSNDQPVPAHKPVIRSNISNSRPSRGTVNSGRTFTRSDPKNADSAPIEAQLPPRKRYPVASPPSASVRSQPVQESLPRSANDPKPPRSVQKNVPPRLVSQHQKSSSHTNTSSVNRPKRYSSLRQRNMAEGSSNYSPEQRNRMSSQFYDAGGVYNKSSCHVNQGSASASMITNMGSVPATAAGHYHPNYNSQAYSSIPPNISTGTASPAQMYSAAPPIQTPYIAAPAPNNMNYGPPPAAASYGGTVAPFTPPPAAYQAAQPYTASATTVATVPVSQPQEVFHGGMAFYNTHTQSMGRNAPNKRPKAAIPIVPPPDRQNNGIDREQVGDKYEEVQFTLSDNMDRSEKTEESQSYA